MPKVICRAPIATPEAIRNYRRMVRRLAAGNNDPEFAEVCEVLTAARKTADELTRDIAERQRRESMRDSAK